MLVRKMGGIVADFAANENVVDKCIEKIREIDPKSQADNLFYVSIITEPLTIININGFDFMSDDNGKFTTIYSVDMDSPEIYTLSFNKDVANTSIAFTY